MVIRSPQVRELGPPPQEGDGIGTLSTSDAPNEEQRRKTVDGKLKATAAIVRCWNNPHVERQVRNLLTIGVGRIIVVVDSAKEGPDNTTRAYLGNLLLDGRVFLIEMRSGFTWANALNRALMSIQMANVHWRARGEDAFRFVLPISIEAHATREHIAAMLDAATDDPTIGVVGMTFAARQSGNAVELGRSYRHPRNTCMLIRIEAFGQLFGGFDPRCDDLGGMEDIEFVLRMRALSDLTAVMLDLQVPLIVGVNWHQPTKEVRERKAMDDIIAMWRLVFPDASPEAERINTVIAKMRLEE